MTRAEALEVLDFEAQPTLDELKARYKALARELHPDTGGTPANFARLNEAYRLLSIRAPAKHPCEICSGTGRAFVHQGFYAIKVRCTACKGTGKRQ